MSGLAGAGSCEELSCGGGWASSGSESVRKIVIVRNLHTAWTPTLHIPSSPSPLSSPSPSASPSDDSSPDSASSSLSLSPSFLSPLPLSADRDFRVIS